jgi:hypothetical protein
MSADPKFDEPWKFEIAGPKDYRALPISEFQTGSAEEQTLQAHGVTQAVVWSGPPVAFRNQETVPSGEIVFFSTLRGRSICERRAKRVVECVNSFAGVDDPQATLEEVRSYLLYVASGRSDGVKTFAAQLLQKLGRPLRYKSPLVSDMEKDSETRGTDEDGVLSSAD